MLARSSLLDELKKGGYEASLITTFNAYLPFYEEVVLRRLINAGVRHNVLLMDAREYSAAMASYPPLLAGTQYTLLPIQAPGAFHPKLILLVGKTKGLIVIGSHNMTLAGFGFNRELTNIVRVRGEKDAEGVAAAQQLWSEVDYWMTELAPSIPPKLAAMVHRVLDFAPWMKNPIEPKGNTQILASRPGGRALWDQTVDLVDDDVTKVAVSGAFFDKRLAFLDRVKTDLKPREFVVGVDPSSVQLPVAAENVSDLAFVNAAKLGVEDDKADQKTGYLHAKNLLITYQTGNILLATGSANPSAPAWLASKASGNVELMLVRRGQAALEAAESIGLTDMYSLPRLSASDWEAIAVNEQAEYQSEPLGYKTGVAYVDGHTIFVDASLLDGLADLEYVLVKRNADEDQVTRNSKARGGLVEIDFPAESMATAISLQCKSAGEVKISLLLHHIDKIEEQARSGVQRQFKDALLSLGTETPNIGLLIECLDKIVFSEDSDRVLNAIRPKTASQSEDSSVDNELGGLAVDIDDTKKLKKKSRLNQSGDLGYLLDTLIYHLKILGDKSLEELDQHGRSEEEQIGTDDAEGDDGLLLTEERQRELLDICHSKVNTMIGRMISQLRAFTEGKQSIRAVLLRLLSVLAVLRELRSCDKRAAWVGEGNTTIPREQRIRLLDSLMLSLFEGDNSLLDLEDVGDEFGQSDDIARLKGLVLWLAWDCSLVLDLQAPFMESQEQREMRLRGNAMVLALAQMIREDEVVIDEAKQSIGKLSTGEMSWLKSIRLLGLECDALRSGTSAHSVTDEAEPGLIAIHKTVSDWNLRVVVASGSQTSLVRLSKYRATMNFLPEHLFFVKFPEVQV